MGARAAPLAIALALLLAVSTTRASQTNDLQQIQESFSAIEESKRGFTEALLAFLSALEGRDGDEGYRVWAALATMERSLDRWDESVATLERTAGPLETAGARLLLAQVYLDQHRLDDALRECQRSLELDPTRLDGYLMLGWIHDAESRLELAAEAWRQATMADPRHALAFYRLASSYESQGQASEATIARDAFVGAAEGKLDGLWNTTESSLSQSARARLLDERDEFFGRRSPIDFLASAASGLTVFLPAAYEDAARLLVAGAFGEAVAALRLAAGTDPLVRSVPDLGADPERQLQTARERASSSSAGADAHAFLGDVLLSAGQPEEARRALEQALTIDETLEPPRLRLASIAIGEADGTEAIRQLQLAAQHAPTSSEPHRLLGNIFRAAEDLDAAITQLTRALALNPTDERTHSALLEALLAAQRNEAVEEAVRAAVDANPRSGLAQQNLGRFLQSVGRNQDATTALRAALGLYPLVAVDRLHLRIAEIQTGQQPFDPAIEAFRDALEVSPGNAVPRLWIAGLLMESNRLDEAYAEYLTVLLIDPLNVEAHTNLAQLELQRGNLARAVASARRAVEENPEHLRARYALGQALMRSGAVDEGRSELAEYSRLQAEGEERASRQRERDALNQEALRLASAGDLESAIELLRQVVEMEPSGSAHSNLGLALMEAGRLDDAIESFEMAATMGGASTEIHLFLSEAYRQVGRTDDSERARATYERLRAGQR